MAKHGQAYVGVVTVTDAGPLVALIDADEPDHGDVPALSRRGGLRVATHCGGWTNRLEVLELSRSAVERSATLMTRYSDLPMDLADATLVALAEERGDRRVFTLDSDFEVYRLHGRQRFDIVPGPR